MLRANVGLSRKLSRDYQSTGYTINIDGEIPFTPDDAEGVLEKVRELFDLAQEALNQEIDRDQGEMAIGRRDEEPTSLPVIKKGITSNIHARAFSPIPTDSKFSNENGSETNGAHDAKSLGKDEAATNKQVQFILTVGRRFKLSSQQLESRILEVVGRKCGVYDLTKKEAGKVLDQLTNGNQSNHQHS